MPVVSIDGKAAKRMVSKSSIPWYKDFESVKEYNGILEEELDAFWQCTEKQWAEAADIREDVITTIAHAAQRVLGADAVATLGGAAALGVFISVDAFHVDVALPGEMITPTKEVADDFVAVLQQSGLVASYVADNQIKCEVPSVSHPSDTFICFVNLVGDSVQRAALMRNLQRTVNMTHTKIACPASVVGQVLRQSNLLSEANYGISELALVVAVLGCLKGDHLEGAKPIFEVFTKITASFNNLTDTISTNGISVGTRPVGASPLSIAIINPVNGENMTSGCLRFTQIRENLKHCLGMLQKWDETGRKKPYAYKGKSPLSSIIAIKHLAKAKKDLPKQPAKKEQAVAQKSKPLPIALFAGRNSIWSGFSATTTW
eukprot:TRINITY_DN30880_c0_g1_i1.p1 TRINITY_DN30880_c0_g1~~TRINITY_DN30880_c0_g1_i1.p1  ORF type:complete len:374 (+),score=84.17 TRINITY_DN30880_c0_g1_i1:62-1183(+)